MDHSNPDDKVFVPCHPTDEMIEAGLQSTNARLNIPGSATTVNREKMRIRYQAMLDARPADCGREVVFSHEQILCGSRFDAGRYRIFRLDGPAANPDI